MCGPYILCPGQAIDNPTIKCDNKTKITAGPAGLLVENCKSLAHNAMESGGKTRYGYYNRSRITPHTPLQEGNHGKE